MVACVPPPESKHLVTHHLRAQNAKAAQITAAPAKPQTHLASFFCLLFTPRPLAISITLAWEGPFSQWGREGLEVQGKCPPASCRALSLGSVSLPAPRLWCWLSGCTVAPAAQDEGLERLRSRILPKVDRRQERREVRVWDVGTGESLGHNSSVAPGEGACLGGAGAADRQQGSGRTPGEQPLQDSQPAGTPDTQLSPGP